MGIECIGGIPSAACISGMSDAGEAVGPTTTTSSWFFSSTDSPSRLSSTSSGYGSVLSMLTPSPVDMNGGVLSVDLKSAAAVRQDDVRVVDDEEGGSVGAYGRCRPSASIVPSNLFAESDSGVVSDASVSGDCDFEVDISHDGTARVTPSVNSEVCTWKHGLWIRRWFNLLVRLLFFFFSLTIFTLLVCLPCLREGVKPLPYIDTKISLYLARDTSPFVPIVSSARNLNP
jgi:hypothetical protein